MGSVSLWASSFFLHTGVFLCAPAPARASGSGSRVSMWMGEPLFCDSWQQTCGVGSRAVCDSVESVAVLAEVGRVGGSAGAVVT